MLKWFFYCLVFISINCSHKLTNNKFAYRGIPRVDLCDLSKYEGQLVYTQGFYSGVVEYWSLNAGKKCDIQIELDTYKDGNPIPKKFDDEFQSVLSNYWNRYLVIEVIGTFESKNPNGYGHLGSNKSRFIVKEFISVKLVDKNK